MFLFDDILSKVTNNYVDLPQTLAGLSTPQGPTEDRGWGTELPTTQLLYWASAPQEPPEGQPPAAPPGGRGLGGGAPYLSIPLNSLLQGWELNKMMTDESVQ